MFHLVFGVPAFPKKKSSDGEILLEGIADIYDAESFTVVKGAGVWLLQLSYSTKRRARSVYKEAKQDFFIDNEDFLDALEWFGFCKKLKLRFLILQDEDHSTVAS